jgi:hypothetical protein
MASKHKRKSKAKLKKDLWKIFSRYIRLRDAIKTTGDVDFVSCVTCLKIKPIKQVDAGHFITRSRSYLLFDEQNVHAQCKKCNMPPDPGEQYLYSEQIKQMYGDQTMKRLQKDKEKEKKFELDELEQMIIDYKNKIKDITSEYNNPWK